MVVCVRVRTFVCVCECEIESQLASSTLTDFNLPDDVRGAERSESL